MSEILRQYRAMAATGLHFRGLTVMQHEEAIRLLVQRHKARTILDYGAGAGEAWDKPFQLHKRLGVERPTLYDPAFKHNTLPACQFHGVICSDVLEHVPEAAVPGLISRLFGYAERFVFASVCCRPAGKTFPDGTNLHVTVRPYGWWAEKFEELSPSRKGVEWVLTETP